MSNLTTEQIEQKIKKLREQQRKIRKAEKEKYIKQKQKEDLEIAALVRQIYNDKSTDEIIKLLENSLAKKNAKKDE